MSSIGMNRFPAALVAALAEVPGFGIYRMMVGYTPYSGIDYFSAGVGCFVAFGVILVVGVPFDIWALRRGLTIYPLYLLAGIFCPLVPMLVYTLTYLPSYDRNYTEIVGFAVIGAGCASTFWMMRYWRISPD